MVPAPGMEATSEPREQLATQSTSRPSRALRGCR